jgi:hypothetical protein
MKYISENLLSKDPPNPLNNNRMYRITYYTGLEMCCIGSSIIECINMLNTGKNVKCYGYIKSWNCLIKYKSETATIISSYVNSNNRKVIETSKVIAYVDEFGPSITYFVVCKDTLQSMLLLAN